jgi:hypothetical protein
LPALYSRHVTREEIIAMLRQYIEGIEFGQERIDPRETKQQQVDLALEEAKDLLERVRADDEESVRQISAILDQY